MPLNDTSPGYAPGSEIGYTQVTASVNITDTSESTATALISPGALPFDGGPVIVEFFSPAVVCDNSAPTDLVTITLFEGATQIARLGLARTVVTAAPNASACFLRYRFTPSAGVHTYKLCAFVTVNVGGPLIAAGAGGTGAYAPAYVRFTKV
jgi:hypothetical protein